MKKLLWSILRIYTAVVGIIFNPVMLLGATISCALTPGSTRLVCYLITPLIWVWVIVIIILLTSAIFFRDKFKSIVKNILGPWAFISGTVFLMFAYF